MATTSRVTSFVAELSGRDVGPNDLAPALMWRVIVVLALTLGAVFVGAQIRALRFGPAVEAPVVGADLLGARSGVDVTLEGPEGELLGANVPLLAFYDNAESMTILPNADPVIVLHGRGDSGDRQWAALGFALSVLLVTPLGSRALGLVRSPLRDEESDASAARSGRG